LGKGSSLENYLTKKEEEAEAVGRRFKCENLIEDTQGGQEKSMDRNRGKHSEYILQSDHKDDVVIVQNAKRNSEGNIGRNEGRRN